MKSLDNIAEDLFNKIRGRFPSVTIGDAEGKVTNEPTAARFFDFDFKDGERNIGKVSISVSEEKIAVMYSEDFVENENDATKSMWYQFLRELRSFAKKRLLQFDTRDITKSNLNKRDYQFLAQQNSGESPMSESKLYGTGKVSYQNIGSARLNIRHSQHVNTEVPTSRTQHIDKIYIESPEGERFMYPYRHLNGARAMARHVSEGGKPYDDFGKHIVGLSEELAKLRKFKNYMNRSSVMAESLAEYMDAVVERIDTVKNEISKIQKQSFYAETLSSFEAPVLEDVPADVAENWIDQLTIKQFNEELKDIFPYIYRLVSEARKAKEIGPDDFIEGLEDPDDNPCWKGYKPVGTKKKNGKTVPNCVPANEEYESEINKIMGQFAEDDDADEGNAFTMALAKARDDDEDEMEVDGKKIPVTEFILSMYDRETGQFPKGETAVLTAVEKDYGEQYINPAKAFIEAINAKFEEIQMRQNPQQMEPQVDQDFERMRELAGLR